MKNRDHDLLAHIVIPSPHAKTKDLTPKDYQITEVPLGNPIVDMTKVIITTGIKKVFKNLYVNEN